MSGDLAAAPSRGDVFGKDYSDCIMVATLGHLDAQSRNVPVIDQQSQAGSIFHNALTLGMHRIIPGLDVAIPDRFRWRVRRLQVWAALRWLNRRVRGKNCFRDT